MTPSPLPERIQWHEGMLLTPQHFQQESARVDALVAWCALAAQPLAWGVRTLELDEAMLVGGTVRVLRLEAVLPDGMAVSFDAATAQGQDLQVDLAPHAEALEQGDVPVFLVLGRVRSMRQPGQGAMFRGVSCEPVADEVSAAEPVDIPRMVPHLGLMAAQRPSSAHLSMQLLTVRKDKEVCRRGAYLPAMLQLPVASEPFQRASLLAAQMRSKAAFMAKQTAHPSSKLEDRLAMLEQRGRLASLMQALPPLEALLRSPAVSPFGLYLALCAQLGVLALLRPGAIAPLPPAWEPADPLRALMPVLQALEELVGEVSQQWRAEVWRFDGDAFSIDPQPQWLTSRLIVGLRGGAERDLVAWMSSSVIGSQTTWTTLNQRRVLGAARRQIEEAPELGLRAGSGHVLFAIEVADAFIVPGQPLLVSNANGGAAGQRPEEMVLFVKG